MVEHCIRDKGKRFLHPIIDWTTAEVWQFIREHGIEYCCLYDEGFKRLGCVMCPMVRYSSDLHKQMERWPQLARAWERAVKATFKPTADKNYVFETTEEYWQWWLDRDAPGLRKDPDQRMMFED